MSNAIDAFDTREVIIRLLANLGSRREVDQYLRHYASVDSPKFAIIKVSGSVLEEQSHTLVSSLAFLKRVGLLPIVVHGASLQIHRACEAEGVPLTNVRSVEEKARSLDITRRTLIRENLRFVEALENMGTRARPLTHGIFHTADQSASSYNQPAQDLRVDEEQILASIRAQQIPVIVPLGESKDGRIRPVPSDDAAYALAKQISPHKLIRLTSEGVLRDAMGRPYAAINLAEDYEEIANQKNAPDLLLRRLAELKSVLEVLPPFSSVSITTPSLLAKELFTHKGAGTLVRLGEKLKAYRDFSEVDTKRLTTLLEACFGRRLSSSYYSEKKPFRIYLADSYRATAILTREMDVPYLDKFAVTTEAQGAGIGASLWRRMTSDEPKFYWRARADNPINTWYFQHAAGAMKQKEWVVFWNGIDSYDEIKSCVDHALSLPATLRAHGTGDV